MRFMIAALLAVLPMLVHAQRQVCNISPPPSQCQIANNQVCPGGCVRPRNCPGVVTVTSTTVYTTTRARTTITSFSTVTNTTTATVTSSISASVITVTASASALSISSNPPPACKTEAPYANVYAFPDSKCTNTSGLQPESSNPFVVNGLVGAPYKFSNLTYNATRKYNESSCVTLPDTEGGARSMYFTVDGIPIRQGITCTVNLYIDSQCQGNGDNSPARYLQGDANTCEAARLPGNAAGISENGPWRSLQYKCAYLRELCGDDPLGLCIKY